MREEDFLVKIGSVVLSHPITNAAGTVKRLDGVDGVKKLALSSVSALMLGTITKGFTEGNIGVTSYWGDGFTLNAIGLSNPGLNYYKDTLGIMRRHLCEAPEPKPHFVSVLGFNSSEFAELCTFFLEKEVDLVELNLSCPNVLTEREQRITCFIPEHVEEILSVVQKEIGKEVNISVKLAPFADSFLLDKIVRAIAQFEMVKALTVCNSFPGAYMCDYDGNSVIRTEETFLGGMSGSALMPIALGQIVQIKSILSNIGSDIKIIGVGGISTGLDVWKFLENGADAIQIGTAYLEKTDSAIFSEILTDFVDIVEFRDIKNSPYVS